MTELRSTAERVSELQAQLVAEQRISKRLLLSLAPRQGPLRASVLQSGRPGD